MLALRRWWRDKTGKSARQGKAADLVQDVELQATMRTTNASGQAAAPLPVPDAATEHEATPVVDESSRSFSTSGSSSDAVQPPLSADDFTLGGPQPTEPQREEVAGLAIKGQQVLPLCYPPLLEQDRLCR